MTGLLLIFGAFVGFSTWYLPHQYRLVSEAAAADLELLEWRIWLEHMGQVTVDA